MSASIWVDGLGEVASRSPGDALVPASNEKLLTAVAALSVLGPDTTLATKVVVTGPVADGVVAGDMVLVGGGDPALNSAGRHSLDDLAAQVRAQGITTVTGHLVGDETRYDNLRAPPSWRPTAVPGQSGSLSALTVDRNQYRADPGYLAHPVPATVELFRAALARHGVEVAGPTASWAAPADSETVAVLPSAPVSRIVADMLTRSDNQIAELLLKEVGYRRLSGAAVSGTTAGGAAAAEQVARELGVPLSGTTSDGSGLSRQNRRTAHELTALLRAALSQPWAGALLGGLPVAGHTGTLEYRFRGTPAQANLRAKTGYVPGTHALSGYVTTAGNRLVVVSLIVNNTENRIDVRHAMDDVMVALAADRS